MSEEMFYTSINWQKKYLLNVVFVLLIGFFHQFNFPVYNSFLMSSNVDWWNLMDKSIYSDIE